MKIVDMTHVMNVHTPGWVGYAGNKMYYAQNLQTQMIVAQRIDTALHVGTHFDGAMHATDNRKGDMASLPLDYLVNRGVVVDISRQDVGLGRDHAGDDRERRRRHPRGRHLDPAHGVASPLRGSVPAGSGEVLLLPPRPQSRHPALDVREEDQVVGHGHRLMRPCHEHVDPHHAAGPRRAIHQVARQDPGRILRDLRIHPQEIQAPGRGRRLPVSQLGVPGRPAARREPRRRYRAHAQQARADRRVPLAIRGPRRLSLPHRRLPRCRRQRRGGGQRREGDHGRA